MPRLPLAPRPPRAAEWTIEAAEAAARARGLTLSAAHWQVLLCAREECLSTRHRPDACALARTTGLTRARIEELFPGDSCALVAELAGLRLEPCGRPG